MPWIRGEEEHSETRFNRWLQLYCIERALRFHLYLAPFHRKLLPSRAAALLRHATSDFQELHSTPTSLFHFFITPKTIDHGS